MFSVTNYANNLVNYFIFDRNRLDAASKIYKEGIRANFQIINRLDYIKNDSIPMISNAEQNTLECYFLDRAQRRSFSFWIVEKIFLEAKINCDQKLVEFSIDDITWMHYPREAAFVNRIITRKFKEEALRIILKKGNPHPVGSEKFIAWNEEVKILDRMPLSDPRFGKFEMSLYKKAYRKLEEALAADKKNQSDPLERFTFSKLDEEEINNRKSNLVKKMVLIAAAVAMAWFFLVGFFSNMALLGTLNFDSTVLPFLQL
jgi:hypothetical protein